VHGAAGELVTTSAWCCWLARSLVASLSSFLSQGSLARSLTFRLKRRPRRVSPQVHINERKPIVIPVEARKIPLVTGEVRGLEKDEEALVTEFAKMIVVDDMVDRIS